MRETANSAMVQNILKSLENARSLTHLEVKTCHNGEPLHCQLLGGLLVTMATTAFDFGTAPQVLGSCEPAAQVYTPQHLPGAQISLNWTNVVVNLWP